MKKNMLDKNYIRKALNQLSKKINSPVSFDFRLKHQSLYAWCIYEEFIFEIINHITDACDYSNLDELYTVLEIETFSINANGDLNNELAKLRKHIETIEKKIK